MMGRGDEGRYRYVPLGTPRVRAARERWVRERRGVGGGRCHTALRAGTARRGARRRGGDRAQGGGHASGRAPAVRRAGMVGAATSLRSRVGAGMGGATGRDRRGGRVGGDRRDLLLEQPVPAALTAVHAAAMRVCLLPRLAVQEAVRVGVQTVLGAGWVLAGIWEEARGMLPGIRAARGRRGAS